VQTLTVQDLVKAWLLDGVTRKDGNAELQRRFKKDLLPALGKTAMCSGQLIPDTTLSFSRPERAIARH
jgi:hypothetical protein